MMWMILLLIVQIIMVLFDGIHHVILLIFGQKQQKDQSVEVTKLKIMVEDIIAKYKILMVQMQHEHTTLGIL